MVTFGGKDREEEKEMDILDFTPPAMLFLIVL